jgi:hypothetical protein
MKKATLNAVNQAVETAATKPQRHSTPFTKKLFFCTKIDAQPCPKRNGMV